MKLALGQPVILTTGDICQVEKRHRDGTFTLCAYGHFLPPGQRYNRRGRWKRSAYWSQSAINRYSLRGVRGRHSAVIRVTRDEFVPSPQPYSR